MAEDKGHQINCPFCGGDIFLHPEPVPAWHQIIYGTEPIACKKCNAQKGEILAAIHFLPELQICPCCRSKPTAIRIINPTTKYIEISFTCSDFNCSQRRYVTAKYSHGSIIFFNFECLVRAWNNHIAKEELKHG